VLAERTDAEPDSRAVDTFIKVLDGQLVRFRKTKIASDRHGDRDEHKFLRRQPVLHLLRIPLRGST